MQDQERAAYLRKSGDDADRAALQGLSAEVAGLRVLFDKYVKKFDDSISNQAATFDEKSGNERSALQDAAKDIVKVSETLQNGVAAMTVSRKTFEEQAESARRQIAELQAKFTKELSAIKEEHRNYVDDLNSSYDAKKSNALSSIRNNLMTAYKDNETALNRKLSEAQSAAAEKVRVAENDAAEKVRVAESSAAEKVRAVEKSAEEALRDVERTTAAAILQAKAAETAALTKLAAMQESLQRERAAFEQQLSAAHRETETATQKAAKATAAREAMARERNEAHADRHAAISALKAADDAQVIALGLASERDAARADAAQARASLQSALDTYRAATLEFTKAIGKQHKLEFEHAIGLGHDRASTQTVDRSGEELEPHHPASASEAAQTLAEAAAQEAASTPTVSPEAASARAASPEAASAGAASPEAAGTIGDEALTAERADDEDALIVNDLVQADENGGNTAVTGDGAESELSEDDSPTAKPSRARSQVSDAPRATRSRTKAAAS